MSDPRRTECSTCKGRGLVRLEWNERIEYAYEPPYYENRFKDEWCRRCDGKGVITEAEPIPEGATEL